MSGSACGSWILKNIFQALAPVVRAKSRISGSTDLKPATLETTIGKKQSRKTISSLGV